MNPRINKIIGDIEKTKAKIAEYNSRLREFERLKTEYENTDIVAMVRSVDLPPAELETFLRAFMEQRKNSAVPDNVALATDKRPFAARVDDDDKDEKEDGNNEE